MFFNSSLFYALVCLITLAVTYTNKARGLKRGKTFQPPALEAYSMHMSILIIIILENVELISLNIDLCAVGIETLE